MLTLNQEVEILKNFSLKHKQLNSFYFGDESETLNSIKPVYPLMEAILQGSSYDKGSVNRRYLILISDLVNKDESNEAHVLSDCELICFDLINYLRGVANSGLVGTFKVNENISLTDFTERSNDAHAGHFFELSITSHIESASCNLPINSGNILDSNYLYVGGTISNNFLVEIKDQDGNVLQTFNTSGEYTVEVLQRIIDTITSNTTTIIDPII